MVDVLQGGQSAILVIQWHHQPTVSCSPCTMHSDGFLGQVWVILECCLCASPDFLYSLAGYLVLTLNGCFSQGFGLGQSFGMGHFFKLGELAPHICTPGDFHSCPPATESTGWDSITEHQVPAWFVNAWRAFGA